MSDDTSLVDRNAAFAADFTDADLEIKPRLSTTEDVRPVVAPRTWRWLLWRHRGFTG